MNYYRIESTENSFSQELVDLKIQLLTTAKHMAEVESDVLNDIRATGGPDIHAKFMEFESTEIVVTLVAQLGVKLGMIPELGVSSIISSIRKNMSLMTRKLNNKWKWIDEKSWSELQAFQKEIRSVLKNINPSGMKVDFHSKNPQEVERLVDEFGRERANKILY